MTDRPSALVRRSLGSDPWLSTLVFVASAAAFGAAAVQGDPKHDVGGGVVAGIIVAIVVTMIVRQVRKWRWWRRLHHLPVPLDVASYVRALDGFADSAHLEVTVTFAGPAPQLSESTIDGNVANVVSPTYRTRNRDSRPYAQFHTNAKLDRWFRRLLPTLERIHRTQPIESITVNHRPG